MDAKQHVISGTHQVYGPEVAHLCDVQVIGLLHLLGEIDVFNRRRPKIEEAHGAIVDRHEDVQRNQNR